MQCPESETLINQPSRLVKAVEKLMNGTNYTTKYDDMKNESFIEDAKFLEDYIAVEENTSTLTDYDVLKYEQF